ncbi:MAG: base excision DNA repair protein [Terracidiphilus sp.]
MKAPQRLSPAKRLRRMHDELARVYGPQHWWPAETAFQVVIGAYLTQNTAWKAVERSLANLREAGAMTFEGLRSLAVERLQELIRPSGFPTRKALALKAFVAMLEAEFGGSLKALAATPTPTLRERLIALPGVGPETADAILLYALNHPVPVADEYLLRIVERHRLISPAPGRNKAGYASLVQLTQEAFATDPSETRALLFNEFHALTVGLGKAHCGRQPNCTGCPLAADLLSTYDELPKAHFRR